MRIDFHGLECEVPDDWHDESTILFTMPVGDGPRAKERQANLSITWDAQEKRDPHVVLDQKMKKLAKTQKSYELLETGQLEEAPVAIPREAKPGAIPRAIPFAVYRFRATRLITQILFAKRVDEELVLICGTATAEIFDETRAGFERSARALKRKQPTT